MPRPQTHPQARLEWNGVICPRNDALLMAIASKNRKHVYKHEQAYILTICATPNGCDINFILQAVNAHHQRGQDPQKIVDHLWQLTQRGIIERNDKDQGKYRVKAEVILKLQGMLEDNEKRSGIVVAGS